MKNPDMFDKETRIELLRTKLDKIIPTKTVFETEMNFRVYSEISTMVATPEEVKWAKNILNPLMFQFYIPTILDYAFTSPQPRWDLVEEVNTVIEKKLEGFDWCLFLFKTYVYSHIFLAIPSIFPTYDGQGHARRFLYADWYENGKSSIKGVLNEN